VIAVSDLTGAIADYSALGFHVLPAGKHQHAPTQNALVVFEDGAYFELIDWTQADHGDRWYRELSHYGESLVNFALLPPDLNEMLAQADAHRLGYKGPIDGSRGTPKGDRLEWQLGRPVSAELPCFCADITRRSLRVAEGKCGRRRTTCKESRRYLFATGTSYPRKVNQLLSLMSGR
jgi:hypothetical protein